MSVALVGAGPGARDLITVRGLELVRACQALVYDRLVSPELVAEAPPEALRLPREQYTQEQVNVILAELGRTLRIVRLKGGDPFVFGRGGEEAEALAEAGVPFEVVPGVSALAAAPAAAGIPLTRRGVSSAVLAVAGHERLDYERLVESKATLVLFMALERLPVHVRGLLAAGMAPDTPAAVVSRATRADQQVVTAPLDELPAAASGLRAPALVVIGDVVALADRLRAPTAYAAAG
ncbi:MAG TPA: uroporphyrinogen-III C-methyltransferase [Gaiellaceae bacterium]|jgi:uroporphyrin-III C-methyltransferase